MTSSTFSGLGGGVNHSLRDVGKAEPRAEVDRSIASQGSNVDIRSLFELPVTQNPHNDARTWGCGLKTEDMPASDSRANYNDGRLYNADLSSKASPMRMDTQDNANSFGQCGTDLSSNANPMRMDTPDNANSFVQRGTWKTDSSMYDSASARIIQPEVRPNYYSEFDRKYIRKFIVDRIGKFDKVNPPNLTTHNVLVRTMRTVPYQPNSMIRIVTRKPENTRTAHRLCNGANNHQ